METICKLLPQPINLGCDALRLLNGAKVAKLLNEGGTPDTVCNTLKACKRTTATCRLFPKPKHTRTEEEYDNYIARLNREHQFDAPIPIGSLKAPIGNSTFCKYFKVICDIINEVKGHKPAIDVDLDFFSTEPTLRGSDWRGKDCDDLNKDVYPGRLAKDGDPVVDSNCNGIFGYDLLKVKTYEDMWCKGTQQFGTMVAGDSVGAHFHIPPDWLNCSAIGKDTYTHLLSRVENELDWPMLSTTTGHFNTTRYEPDEHGPMDSLYRRLFNINRCNHRDYQNLAVNGARAESVYKDVLPALMRNVKSDQPVIFNLEVVGNDVCDHQHSISHMTTPAEYAKWMTMNFQFLDSKLPMGSHVISIGLVDGRVLYDNMHGRIHPIGWVNKDVNYTALYDYLNCLDVSPCWGWMNSNETVRNLTYKRAMELNVALAGAIKKVQPTLKNIKIHYLGDVLYNALQAWKAKGRAQWELIEPVDGFHPNQLGNWWFTQYIWPLLEKIPGLLPPVNPHNEDIIKKFGNQGGY
eukprot:TRINITY_DN85441_c0_g1_i1.p1 TRINITY_DN85441_c0_g1~~TRINITY_DN85441_c0_g1_i1.p1  ORF type:complete len:579 (+),score=59.10 TRINITY_DN85441_c0_g1_i1:180-1739(+)